MKELTEEVIFEKLGKELSEGRRRHCLMAGEVAEEMAREQGLSAEEVREAKLGAMLHDVAKEFSPERNRECVEKYRLGAELLSEEAKNYVHAEVGAEVARELGLGERGVRGIKYHTRPVLGMGKVEKIIFLADKFGREKLSPELGGVREVAKRDLNRAMLEFLEMQAEELNGRGISQSEETKKLVEELRKREENKR